jgi:ubiquitin-like protein 4
MPHSMSRPAKPPAPGSAPSLTILLRSLRNPPLSLSLSSQRPTTSILDLKQAVASELGLGGTEKIRILHNKKPCADSKAVKDLVGEEAKEVEFGVMVIGGVPTPAGGKGDVAMEDAPVAQGESGSVVLESKEFWQDLRGYLDQRVGGEGFAEKVVQVFEKAWKEEIAGRGGERVKR